MTAITGAHSILYSTNPEADRAFLRDVLGFPHVDAGGGWLIFGLPPAEVAVHPSGSNDVHKLYLMCDDIHALRKEMDQSGIATTDVQEEGWGLLTHLTLPGGGRLGVYQPRHVRPPAVGTPAQSRSGALLDVLGVFCRAGSVFGSPERAREWLQTALPALGGQRPIDLCDTVEGRRLVQDAIRRIEYGEFS